MPVGSIRKWTATRVSLPRLSRPCRNAATRPAGGAAHGHQEVSRPAGYAAHGHQEEWVTRTAWDQASREEVVLARDDDVADGALTTGECRAPHESHGASGALPEG